jgi:hypothetical protein
MPRPRRALTRQLIKSHQHQLAATALTNRAEKLAKRAKVRQFAANKTQKAAMFAAAKPAGKRRARARIRFM